MLDVRTEIAAAVDRALAAIGADGVSAALERSARPEFGDWSSPAALKAARVLRRRPAEIAEELAVWLRESGPAFVREWTVSNPGYLNAWLAEGPWAEAVIGNALALDPGVPLLPPPGWERVAGKTLVEHTATNPNKAAHVGHLRNACIGDTVVRLLRRTGCEVEVNNYIDDTGVQVADVAVGIRELQIEQADGEPFDQYCSRVYVEICRRYEDDHALVERRRQTLHDIEAGDNDVAIYVKELASRIVDHHLRTMGRFGIAYDLLTWESDIIALGFWRQAFELLRESRSIEKMESGPQAGCWVMHLDDAAPVDTESTDAKILVKSDGVATYTAKDIAYQMWKFGLLGRDFHYRRWRGDEGAPVTTASSAAPLDGAVHFGHAARVVNVIDARQAYPQEVVKRALHRLGHLEQSDNSVHLAYEVVALSAGAAAELGVEVEEGRNLYALSGRKGIEVRADELLDRAVERIAERAPDRATAESVAAGAVRYYLLKFSLPQIIAFDFDDALRTTGDTGVYLQFAHARGAGVLRKVDDDGKPLAVPASLEPSERELLHAIDAYRHVLAEASAELSPVTLAGYAYVLATALTNLLEHTPAMVREEDVDLRRFRRRLVAAARATLADALGTLGIPAPERI